MPLLYMGMIMKTYKFGYVSVRKVPCVVLGKKYITVLTIDIFEFHANFHPPKIMFPTSNSV